MLKIGDTAPEFCLKDQSGKDFCLKDARGNWLVLYFYPKDNTPGCTVEAIDFTGRAGEFERLGAEIVGISTDSVESHVRFIEKRELGIRLLSDADKKTVESYGVKGLLMTVRSTFLIDPEGKIREIWEKVKVGGHVEDVLKKLSELKGMKF